MPQFETQEKVDKTMAALREYHRAKREEEKARSRTVDALNILKNASGISGNDAPKIEAEIMAMLGHLQLYGLPETR